MIPVDREPHADADFEVWRERQLAILRDGYTPPQPVYVTSADIAAWPDGPNSEHMPDPDRGMCGADLDAEADRVEDSWSRWREG